MKRWLGCWLLALGCTVSAGTAGVEGTYALEKRRLGPQRTIIRVYNWRTGRTIWTRSLTSHYMTA